MDERRHDIDWLRVIATGAVIETIYLLLVRPFKPVRFLFGMR